MFSIGWSYIVIIGYEKQKCKRQLGLASLGQLSRSVIAFAGQLRLCPVARREQERKQNAVDSEKRSVGDGYLTFASVSETLLSVRRPCFSCCLPYSGQVLYQPELPP